MTASSGMPSPDGATASTRSTAATRAPCRAQAAVMADPLGYAVYISFFDYVFTAPLR